MQRPSWSGFQFPTQFPLESVGGRLNQIGESAMLLDVGLAVVPGLTFPAEFPLEFVASSAALSVTVDVTGKTDIDPILVDVGLKKAELAAMLLDVGISRHELAPLIIEVWIPYEPGVTILDRDRQIRVILPGSRWNYSRRLNEATELSVYIPRQAVSDNIPAGHDLEGFFRENKAQYAEIAAFVQVFTGSKLKASGKINRRTLGELVTIQAYTEEILLGGNLTPAQYGMVWDGWDLADVARDLLDGWQSIRVKDQTQWQSYMVGSSNIDLTTDPGHVMLAKRSNGRYYESGYITLAFGSGEIVNFKRWDRIRWSADSEDPVKTTIQYSTNGTSWSAEFDGGLPEEIGLVPSSPTSGTMYVRINLYTSDTESEDPDGNPVGVTPTVFAVELIARTEGDLVAGNIPDSAGVTVKGIDADHASAFQVLLAACEQNGWEFQVINGALSIAENLGTDRTNDFVLRGGTNMEIKSLGDDDEELCNVLTAYGPGRGINRLEITLRDDASIAQYGEYPVAVEFDANTLAELQAKAQGYLDTHNTPTVAFDVFAAFDHEHEPDYGLGDVVRVADPDTGIVTTARIMDESREFSEDGLSVHLGLGKAGLNLQSVLEGKERPTKPLDPLTPTGVYARGIIKGIVVGCSAPKTDWAYTECHVSTAKGFVPGSATLVDKGKQTRFDIPSLDPGVRYYARLIHVDSSGRRSEPSREVSAAAQYIPVEALPDYSIGVEKFMENIKPPVMVSSLPVLPDPRYTVGTTVFLITDKKLYSTDGNTWTPVGAGTVTADEVMAGIVAAGGITAQHISATEGLNINDRVVVGNLGGRQWGDGTLPSGTAGIWGEDAGLYLRGYARLLMAGTGMDEEPIDLSDFPNLNEPEILVAPRELVTYSPAPGTLSHIIVDAVKQLDGTYRLKAKTLTKGTTVPWGGRSSTTSSWTFTRPTDSTDGKKGVYTDFFICRPTWWVGSGGFGLYTAKLYMHVTNEFNANGDPINWKQMRYFSRSSSGSGTLNWDTALPHHGQWALRVSGSGGGALLVDYARTGLSSSGYRTGDTYLDVNGAQITGTDPANEPSGMSVIYMVFDKG